MGEGALGEGEDLAGLVVCHLWVEGDVENGGVDFWGGVECGCGDFFDEFGGAEEGCLEGEDGHFGLKGGDFLCDFVLDQEGDGGWFVFGLEKMVYEWGGNVVWDVGDDFVGGGGGCEVEGVLVDDFDVFVVGEGLVENWDEGRVEFDGCDLFGFLGEFVGEDAEAGADFDYVVFWRDVGGFDDFAEGGGGDQEILA